MAGAERYLYQRFRPATWREHLCEDLRPVLELIQSLEDNPVADLGTANIKAPELVVALARRPTPETVRQVAAACAGVAHLHVTDDGVGCSRHYIEIDWAWRPAPRKGWIAALAARLGLAPGRESR